MWEYGGGFMAPILVGNGAGEGDKCMEYVAVNKYLI